MRNTGAVAAVLIFISWVCACNNENKNAVHNKPVTVVKDSLKKVTLLGTWKVKLLSESDFDVTDNTLLKGPFVTSPLNETVVFTTDSIIYNEAERQEVGRYVYHRINDTVINVRNVRNNNIMKFFIHHLDADSLSFTNIRLEEKRGNRYEVKIDCSKN